MDSTEECMDKYKVIRETLKHLSKLTFGINSCEADQASAQAKFTTPEHACTLMYFATCDDDDYAAIIELRDVRKGYHLFTKEFEKFDQACRAYEGLYIFYGPADE